MYVAADLVLETTTTTGTGTLTLAGAASNYLTFAAEVGEGNTCSYTIQASNGQLETGVGTVVGSTLERTILISSSTGSKLVLPTGTHQVGVTANSLSLTPGAIGAATAAQGSTADTALQPGDALSIADINLDGGTDIGADLVDADLILVDDGAGGTNRKSALSRVWTYITAKITAGIRPLFLSYKETVYTITDGAGFAINPTNGSIQTITLGASRTPVAANFDAGHAITLMVNDGSARTITWTSVPVTWVGGSAPTLATSGYTVINLWKVGSTIYGMYTGSVA